MLNTALSDKHVVSGMRVTGGLHLGHYHGVLKNWLKLQHEYACFFFAADWHGLTTSYEHPEIIKKSLWDMIIDWLAVGIHHGHAHVFIQSWVPEHAELNLLLSMMTPLGWLERIPSYKDQITKLHEVDLNTLGFLGYPLLQAADILIYGAHYVPVGEDQVPHIEFARDIARRFNFLYGREPGYEQLAEKAIEKMGKKNAKLYRELIKRFQEKGEEAALETALALIHDQAHVSLGDRERLQGYLEGGGKMILTEPEPLLTEVPRLVGVDGQKMSKSYANTISLREEPEVVERKILTMPTDPARVKRTDPGNPEHCPVWSLHKVYSNDDVCRWVKEGCTTAGIGCIDCKRPVIDAINEELAPIQEAVKEYQSDLGRVKNIVAEGSEVASQEARNTLTRVKEAMGLDY